MEMNQLTLEEMQELSPDSVGGIQRTDLQFKFPQTGLTTNLNSPGRDQMDVQAIDSVNPYIQNKDVKINNKKPVERFALQQDATHRKQRYDGAKQTDDAMQFYGQFLPFCGQSGAKESSNIYFVENSFIPNGPIALRQAGPRTSTAFSWTQNKKRTAPQRYQTITDESYAMNRSSQNSQAGSRRKSRADASLMNPTEMQKVRQLIDTPKPKTPNTEAQDAPLTHQFGRNSRNGQQVGKVYQSYNFNVNRNNNYGSQQAHYNKNQLTINEILQISNQTLSDPLDNGNRDQRQKSQSQLQSYPVPNNLIKLRTIEPQYQSPALNQRKQLYHIPRNQVRTLQQNADIQDFEIRTRPNHQNILPKSALDPQPDDLVNQSVQEHSSVGLTRRANNLSEMQVLESTHIRTPLRVQIEQNQATHATLELQKTPDGGVESLQQSYIDKDNWKDTNRDIAKTLIVNKCQFGTKIMTRPYTKAPSMRFQHTVRFDETTPRKSDFGAQAQVSTHRQDEDIAKMRHSMPSKAIPQIGKSYIQIVQQYNLNHHPFNTNKLRSQNLQKPSKNTHSIKIGSPDLDVQPHIDPTFEHNFSLIKMQDDLDNLQNLSMIATDFMNIKNQFKNVQKLPNFKRKQTFLESRKQQNKLNKSVDFSTAYKPQRNLQNIIETQQEERKDKVMKALSMMSNYSNAHKNHSNRKTNAKESSGMQSGTFPRGNLENKTKINVYRNDQKLKTVDDYNLKQEFDWQQVTKRTPEKGSILKVKNKQLHKFSYENPQNEKKNADILSVRAINQSQPQIGFIKDEPLISKRMPTRIQRFNKKHGSLAFSSNPNKSRYNSQDHIGQDKEIIDEKEKQKSVDSARKGFDSPLIITSRGTQREYEYQIHGVGLQSNQKSISLNLQKGELVLNQQNYDKNFGNSKPEETRIQIKETEIMKRINDLESLQKGVVGSKIHSTFMKSTDSRVFSPKSRYRNKRGKSRRHIVLGSAHKPLERGSRIEKQIEGRSQNGSIDLQSGPQDSLRRPTDLKVTPQETAFEVPGVGAQADSQVSMQGINSQVSIAGSEMKSARRQIKIYQDQKLNGDDGGESPVQNDY